MWHVTFETWQVGEGEPSLEISAPWFLWFGGEGVLKIFPQRMSYWMNEWITKVFVEQLRLHRVSKKEFALKWCQVLMVKVSASPRLHYDLTAFKRFQPIHFWRNTLNNHEQGKHNFHKTLSCLFLLQSWCQGMPGMYLKIQCQPWIHATCRLCTLQTKIHAKHNYRHLIATKIYQMIKIFDLVNFFCEFVYYLLLYKLFYIKTFK